MQPSTSKTCTKQGPGILYILNHKYFEFDELPERGGTEYDIRALQDNFKKFDVETIIYNDLKFKDLCVKIREISTFNFSNHSCIIIAILTHGFKNNLLAARDKTYHFNDIISKISTNIYLKSKPKIFLLQTCRGDIDSRITKTVQKFKTDEPALSTDELAYYYCDEMYLLHSAIDEFVSYSDEDFGSPFIRIFCDSLNKYGFHRPISEIFPLVMIEVQKLTSSSQMLYVTTNTKKAYVFGDYSQGTVSSLSPISEGNTGGATSKEPVDTTAEYSYKDNMDGTEIIYGDTITEYTRNKTENESLSNTIRLKNVENEHSGLENVQLEKDQWVPFCEHHIPAIAVVGGTDLDKTLLYVGRAYYENELLPGKVFLNRSLIIIPYKGKEIGLREFEVLTGECYSWVKSNPPGTVPMNAVNGGWTESGEILYIGRAQHVGSLTPGKIKLSDNCLYIPFGNKEVKLLNYEFLVRSSQLPEITTNATKSYILGDYSQGAISTITKGDTVTKDTRNKNENAVLSITIRLKHVQNEVSGLEKDKWVPFCKHNIPMNAVVGGIDLDKTLLYVGRAYYENELLPGKVFLNRSVIGIPYKGKEIGLREFEVLTGECYSWVKSDPPGTVPMNAVNGGWTESGEILYIGRAQHVGSLTPGKIKLSDNCLYIPFGNKEVKLLNYEFLIKTC